jgi:hypothetical protein
VSRVCELRLDEPLQLDSERLADMFVELGEARATHLIALSIDRLEGLVEELERAVRQMRAGDCLDHAGQIRSLGDALGLLSLSNAAKGVTRAVQSRDEVAVAATLARLKRMALRSFRIAEELQHLSG